MHIVALGQRDEHTTSGGRAIVADPLALALVCLAGGLGLVLLLSLGYFLYRRRQYLKNPPEDLESKMATNKAVTQAVLARVASDPTPATPEPFYATPAPQFGHRRQMTSGSKPPTPAQTPHTSRFRSMTHRSPTMVSTPVTARSRSITHRVPATPVTAMGYGGGKQYSR